MTTHEPAGRRSALIFLGFTILVVLAMAAFVGVRMATEDQLERRAAPTTPVTVAAATRMEFARVIEAVGTARANESVALTAKVTDTVSDLAFESGDAVKAGDVVASLTDAQESAELEEALSSVRQARLDFDRARDLLARGAGAQARLDTARAALEQAEARVTAVKARLQDRLIVAPFDGVLGLRLLSRGALVQPGEVVATLDDITTIKLDFSVPEVFLGAIAQGQTIEARTPAFPGEAFPGEVVSLDSRVDPATRTVTVRALIDNEDARLRPGMLLAVELVQDRRIAVGVPEAAVLRTQSTASVFVVEESDAGVLLSRRREIVVGGRRPGFVEARSGLEEGERVVVEGVHRVRDEGEVRIVGRSERSPDPAAPDAAASR